MIVKNWTSSNKNFQRLPFSPPWRAKHSIFPFLFLHSGVDFLGSFFPLPISFSLLLQIWSLLLLGLATAFGGYHWGHMGCQLAISKLFLSAVPSSAKFTVFLFCFVLVLASCFHSMEKAKKNNFLFFPDTSWQFFSEVHSLALRSHKSN